MPYHLLQNSTLAKPSHYQKHRAYTRSMALQIDDNTEFNYLVPLAPSDGNLIGIAANGTVNLLFYQTRKQTGEHIDKVDVTGAVLMTSITDLENYRNAINETLDQYKKSEK